MYGYSTSMFLINSFVYSSAPPVDTEFKITVDTTQAGSASDTFVLPLQNGATSMTVYWGDGNSDVITTYNQAQLTHVYASSGTYQISLDGSFYGIRFAGTGDRLKLSSIDNWGNNQWGQMQFAFYGCTNLVGTYTDSPDTSLVSTMYQTFVNCVNFNSIINFDCSNCTSMYQMFAGCSVFNSDVTFTNTSIVTDMRLVFYTCVAFNSALSIDDTSNVTSMQSMFQATVVFDQDISGFNISSLTIATDMFKYSGLGNTNYDLLLVAWDAYGTSSVPFQAGSAKYSSGAPATARANMISRGWTITDGGAV